MYAVIEIGGKQYRVSPEETILVEKIHEPVGTELKLEKVLLVNKDDTLILGKPYIENAYVLATIINHGKHKKIRVFKYKRRKNYRRTRGHRQPYTELKIAQIVA